MSTYQLLGRLTVAFSRRAGAGKGFRYKTHQKRVEASKSREIARSAARRG